MHARGSFRKMSAAIGRRFVPIGLALVLMGCRAALIDRPDARVHRLMEDRQKNSLGQGADANIGPESADVPRNAGMYDTSPRPIDSTLPESFTKTRPVGAKKMDLSGVSSTEFESIFGETEQSMVKTVGLREALSQAIRHSREIQDAKEALYLAALDLTLERHLWTPQFVASVQAEFADYGQVRDFDRAMTAVSNFAVSQRLPYGGEVTARVINTLMRDLGVHTTSGEPGNFILEANLPLLRGAGRAARESLYSAERDLIYAVRDFERFRRSFVVRVSAAYFNLQQLKMAITNTFVSYKNRKSDWERADFVAQMGQAKDVFEGPRVQSIFRQAEAELISSKEQYASALDRFKILIGLPVEDLLDVVDQNADEDAKSLDGLLPDVDIAQAVDVAVKFRLDLLNSADGVDDARRGVSVARNRILPDLDASGSVALDTDPERLNSASYNTERTTWRGSIELRMDDRFEERNAFRASLVALRRAEREYERATDEVRADVRAAVRRVAQQEIVRQIQAMSVQENEARVEAARAQYELGKITNRDVVEAENDLLNARNSQARALSQYRNAILEFRRDTETLRINDEGLWEGIPSPNPTPSGP